MAKPRDLYPVERPDATIPNTIEAVRAYDPPSNPEILLLKPADVLELVSGKLIVVTTPSGETLLLLYGD